MLSQYSLAVSPSYWRFLHNSRLTPTVFLIVSELTLFRTYFARHWPVLSASHSFIALGVAMEVLGCNILANLNKPQMRKKELGLAFWRVIIGAGILIIIVGVFNIVAVCLTWLTLLERSLILA